MDVINSSRRRWYQFSLRTMFVITMVVSLPLAWLGYQFALIRERIATLDSIMYQGGHYGHFADMERYDTRVMLPLTIREMLGDLPICEIVLTKALENEEPKIRQLFPAAGINFLPARANE